MNASTSGSPGSTGSCSPDDRQLHESGADGDDAEVFLHRVGVVSLALFGGYETAGYIHRFAATIMVGVFLRPHCGSVPAEAAGIRQLEGTAARSRHHAADEKGPETDFSLQSNGSWAGPRPEFGRWTYWEKFDYFAVFWGMVVIGSTGFTLWFPEFFTLLFPGWMLNVATIIHSDEALLATGFIFTVHFFNTHLRPEKFPMDLVIFTGRMPVEELRMDKPAEYAGGGGSRRT